MIQRLIDFQNLGIDSTIDRETVQRIRLGNSMSIIGIPTSFVVLLYSLLASWPTSIILLIGSSTVATFIPPILNSFKKTVASRISFLVIANGLTIIFALLFGSALHFHYFLFALLGLPLMLFGKEFGRKKNILPVIGILFFIYIEWHFYYFNFLPSINLPYSDLICFINDVLVGIMILAQYYFFVNENDQYIGEIKEKSKELKDKNTQLEHFAYIASHDLNEPIRTVNSFVDLIRKEYGSPEDKKINTYFRFIDKALVRMQKMIKGLLNYSRIGKSSNFQRLDLDSLLNEITEDLWLLIKEKQVAIKYNDLPTVDCLRLEVKQLFQNLITNAIKFQHPDSKPEINITWRDLPDYWEFCVADNGIGIKDKKKTQIFQMFTKLHLSSEYKGHGIGLAFCKKIVEIHKGKIWVESTPNNGSQFYFTIKKNIV